MAFRAKLDDNGIYWGVEEVAALADGDVEIPADCDLKPGAYRVVREVDPVRFDPLLPQHIKLAPEAPDFQRAFYDVCVDLHQRNGDVPASTRAWALAYEDSVDADATFGGPTYFRNLPA